MLKKIIITVALLISLVNLAFAAELMAELIQDYYEQGLRCEEMRAFFQAKVFYQKVLLLNPDVEYKRIILQKLYEMNRRLADNGKEEVEPAKPLCRPAQQVIVESCPKENIKVKPLKQLQTASPQIQSPPVAKSQAAKPKIIKPQEVKAPAAQKAPPAVSKRPPKPAALKQFVTHYTGKEKFLRGCNTPECQKILYNNLGITYAKEGNFIRAQGVFEQCLIIDASFEPARINLGILAQMQGKTTN